MIEAKRKLYKVIRLGAPVVLGATLMGGITLLNNYENQPRQIAKGRNLILFGLCTPYKDGTSLTNIPGETTTLPATFDEFEAQAAANADNLNKDAKSLGADSSGQMSISLEPSNPLPGVHEISASTFAVVKNPQNNEMKPLVIEQVTGKLICPTHTPSDIYNSLSKILNRFKPTR